MTCDTCTKQGIYNFACAHCVARFIKSLPKHHVKYWRGYFTRERGDEFVKQVRTLLCPEK